MMLAAARVWAILAAGLAMAPPALAKAGAMEPQAAGLSAAGRPSASAADSMRAGRQAYRPDSVYRRQVLAKARTERDHVETLMDDLAAVEGSLAPAPWDSLKTHLQISLDSLQRLFLAADSSGRAELDQERRADLEPRSEPTRGGGESRRERRDAEESRRR